MLQATTTDEGLLRLVKDWREDEGWREFHRRYAPAIEAHARRSGLTHEQAEDVVQATMIKVATFTRAALSTCAAPKNQIPAQR